jgi:hypothetical protein
LACPSGPDYVEFPLGILLLISLEVNGSNGKTSW